MGDNIPNIDIPFGVWVDLYSLSGIAVGSSLHVENVGSYDIYLAVQATQPTVDHDSYNVVQRGNGIRLQNAHGASGAWAFCNNIGGKVAVGLAQIDGFYPLSGSGSAATIDPDNSTDINLIANDEFTGEWVDQTGYGIVYISCYSDVDSAEDGLIIEQSTNGTEAHFSDVFTITGTIGKNFSINPHARFLRVRYINGPVAQIHFHLQTIFKSNGLASTHRIKDDLTVEDDARLVKSVISTKANDLDEYKNIEFMNPMPIGGDSTYPHDVNISNSDIGNFSGSILDLFDSRFSTISDVTTTNPKVITIAFERTIQSTTMGFATNTGNFSNIVFKYGLTGIADQTLVDESADNTKKTIFIYNTPPLTFSSIIIEFHTADPVSISFFIASKAYQRISQIQGESEFGEPLNIGATPGGNLKVSVQEYGDTPAIDAFDRLRISEPFTIFDSKQLYDKQPLFYNESIGGSATSVHSTVNARTRETVTASATDFVIRQTKQRFNYQPGKALRHGEPVLTIDGFKKIEEIKIGEIVFDGDGKQTKVVGVYPQGKRDIYRITFDDGTFVDCDGEHLWKTIIRQNSKKGQARILTTNQMLKEYGEKPPVFARWRIPKAPILEIDRKPVLVDPYTMGAILGDGSFDKRNGFVQFISADQEILDRLKCEKLVKYDYKKYGYGLYGLGKEVVYYGLNDTTSQTKFIPNDYLLNEYGVRLSVLQGLMDTDGSVDKRDGTTEFNSASIDLAEGVAFLVRSIGGQAIIRKRGSFYRDEDGNKINCLDSYRVRVICPVCPFKLERKAMYWKKRERISFDRYIHSIKKIDNDFATCIMVDSSDHTFLTRNNIVTHNSQLIMLTFQASQEVGVTKRIGLFDGTGTNFLTPNNGVFLEITGTSVSWNIAKNGTITETVIQDNWDADALDGTGLSRITLDWDAAQIAVIDFEWLGVGRVRVGFVIDGLIYYTYFFNHANVPAFPSVYMSTPNLPVRYDIQSNGTGGGYLDHICSTVMSEGGVEETGISRSVDTNGTHLDANTPDTPYILLAIRLKTTHLDLTVLPEFISMISETNDDFRWSLHLNPTYNGTLTWNDLADSGVQYASGATANDVTAVGIKFDSGYSKSASSIDRQIKTSLRIGSTIDGTRDELALVATPLASNADLQGSLTFRELL